MQIHQLNKSVIVVQNNVERLLKGLACNTLEAPFNAFCDIHGKIIATCVQKPLEGDRHALIVEEFCTEELITHLLKYARLSKSLIQQVSKNSYFNLDEDFQGQDEDWVFAMPQGQLIITEHTLESTVCKEQFLKFRLNADIPVHGIDYGKDMLLNVDNSERYISYSKGCFLGQEVLARVHFKSAPPRKLCVHRLEDLDDKLQSKATSTHNGLGFVFLKV